MEAYVFVFNGEDPALGPIYGVPCSSAVIKALERFNNKASTRVLRGDLLPHALAYDIESVSVEEIGKHKSVSQKHTPNMERYKLILCDFADSISGSWSTIDSQEFPRQLATRRTWAVVLPSITTHCAKHIDEQLKTFSAYLGACQIDTGNPLQIQLFNLPGGNLFFSDGKIYFCDSAEDDSNESKAIAKMLTGDSVPLALPLEKYLNECPPPLKSSKTSTRGELSVRRFQGKSRLTHKQKLAQEVLDLFQSKSPPAAFSFDAKLEKDQKEFICAEEKFKNYLLNDQHPDGKGKAKFFIEVLGIARDDWQYLSEQIISAMDTAVLFRVSDGPYGVTHGAYIKIVGRNGREAIIQTAWLAENGKSTRFVTAYPCDEAIAETLAPPESRISPLSLVGDSRWEDIYNRACAAGLMAAQKCVPTPMTLKGYSPIFSGACGFAWITIQDARKGLARWLRKNKIGHRNYRSGWDVFADPEPADKAIWDQQSIEPKIAFAEAFAQVLRDNGVACTTGSRLD